MSNISPEAQALIDRLATMDLANPCHDKAVIERAITTHLAALELPERPIVWIDGPGSDHIERITRARADIDGQDDLAEAVDGTWSDARTEAWVDARSLTWWEDWDEIRHAAWDRARASARAAAGMAAQTDIRWAVWLAPYTAGISEESAEAALLETGTNVFEEVIRVVGEVNAPAAHGYTTSPRLAQFGLPLIDAFEAGLFSFLITRSEVICMLQPGLSIENGRLHRTDGPAVRWPSGGVYHFWQGVQVPSWAIEQPQRITIEVIRSQLNQEVRRCMTEIYGRSRYLRDSGAQLLHEDGFGRLWEAEGQADERWRFVEVEDGTPGPDGTRRTYTLDVTDAAEVLGWPIETARAAVAATYGLREEEYCPEVRT